MRELEVINARDPRTAAAIYAVAERGLPEEVDQDDPDDGLANGWRLRCAITREQRRRMLSGAPDDAQGPHNYVIVYRPTQENDIVQSTQSPCTAPFVILRIIHEGELFGEYEVIRGFYNTAV
ncbi:hypothetical protein [Streptomyces chartreusis]|uniref:hypothetical protein n=1 Tax=Streptomyces chartreusis TaxID=1969 RepID=UPI003791A844